MRLWLLLLFTLIQIPTLYSYIRINDVMTPEEQKMTGVNKLTAKQRAALQAWINRTFELKTPPPEVTETRLYIVENHEGGKRLLLNNNKTYQVAPEDIEQAAFWLSPFPISVESNDNPDYPLKLVNIGIGNSIQVKELSQEELDEIKHRREMSPKENGTPNQPSPPMPPLPQPTPIPKTAPEQNPPSQFDVTPSKHAAQKLHSSGLELLLDDDEEGAIDLPTDLSY